MGKILAYALLVVALIIALCTTLLLVTRGEITP